ncbi:MAG: glycosyltransferase family 39 protein [Candidatus Omnitrophota bacterium]
MRTEKYSRVLGNLYLILGLVSAAIMLTALDKYWAPFDEGIMTVAGEMAMKGFVPYKDFFLVMYPPGQVYVLAFLYKLFGVSLIAGRLYTVLVQVVIALLVMALGEMLAKKRHAAVWAFVFTLTCLGPRMGTIPAPIWPGMCLGLAALYLFGRFAKTGKAGYLSCAGLAAGLTVVFRHDIGFAVFLAITVSGMLMMRERKMWLFALCAAALPSAVIVYFAFQSALPDMFRSLILFTFVHEQTAGLAFPPPCLNPVMIFHGSMHFMNINQYYIPIIVFVSVIVFALPRYFRKKADKDEGALLAAVLLFGILTFNQVRLRTDPAHLLTVIYPSVIMGAYLAVTLWPASGRSRANLIFRRGACAFLVFMFALLMIKNCDKYIKNVYRKPLKGKTVLTKFERGDVYIPVDEVTGVKDVVSYIFGRSAPGERMFVGNVNNSVDAFGGNILLYTLCERLPSAKYYELLPGLITRKSVQEEVASSLAREDTRFAVLQNTGDSGTIKGALDEYISRHFRLKAKFERYWVYEKSGIR